MKALLTTASVLGLGLTVIPAFLVFYGKIEWELHAQLMGVGFVLYFLSAPILSKKKKEG